jgi:hypothetical protein
MSSGTQFDLDWAATEAMEGAQNGAGAAPPATLSSAVAPRHLTDEEILGMEAPSPDRGYGRHARPGGDTRQSVIPSEARNLSAGSADGAENQQRDSSGTTSPRNDDIPGRAEFGEPQTGQAEAHPTGPMPEWMQAAATDPQHGGEAQQLWREHQEFRAAFASPEEARAIKELLPGGVRDVLSLREATQSVERIDAALFSGDPRAQSEVVAELARANPAAFRSLFAEAAKVLAGLGTGGRNAGGSEAGNFHVPFANELAAAPTLHPSSGQALRETREGWGIRNSEAGGQRLDTGNPAAPQLSPAASSRASSRESLVSDHRASSSSLQPPASNLQNFDPTAYAAFERTTNDAVARDVRGSITDTLARVLPDGMADGAARRIGEDIFQEIHRALASDRVLSEQVAAVLRERRFGSAEQQQVASLLAGRARQLVPSVARRVIGEWTSSVLNTSRSKAARQAAAASRVDIAAPGGSLDSMPLRSGAAGSPRGVNYASMTDEQILGI